MDLRHTVFNSKSKPMITWTVVKALGFQYLLLFVSLPFKSWHRSKASLKSKESKSSAQPWLRTDFRLTICLQWQKLESEP